MPPRDARGPSSESIDVYLTQSRDESSHGLELMVSVRELCTGVAGWGCGYQVQEQNKQEQTQRQEGVVIQNKRRQKNKKTNKIVFYHEWWA